MHAALKIAAVALPLVLAVACERASSGERRPLVRHWDGPGHVVRTRGEELRHDGAWVQDGPFEFFDHAGRKVAEGTFTLGLESGPWREIDPDGSVGTGEYEAGKRHGRWSYADEDGTLRENGEYVAGERHGRWSSWYADGSLRSEVTWVHGEQTGLAVFRNRDGTENRQLTGVYEKGAKVD